MTIDELKKIARKEGNYKAFVHMGLPCRILRHTGEKNISLLGYVGIPKSHPLYKKDYTDVSIDVHGGLTYAEDHLYLQPEKDLWWFGFDCAHAGDISFLIEELMFSSESYKDMEYVIAEVKKLAEQLSAIDTFNNKQKDK